MAKGRIATTGKRALTAPLVLCMSLMMVPSTAFADIGGKAYEVEVDASQDDAFNTLGQDVSSSYKPAVGVIADNGHTAEAELGDVMAKDMNRAVLVEADGGGIYLSALLKDAYEGLTVVPPIEALVPLGADSASNAPDEDEVAPVAYEPAPLLVYDGVEISQVKLEMKGQVPTLRVTLSNTNGRDAEFDCGKFKVVNADDGSVIAFKMKNENEARIKDEGKTEVKMLAANAAGIELELIADANACKAGDRVNVFYVDQLLGTFTVA